MHAALPMYDLPALRPLAEHWWSTIVASSVPTVTFGSCGRRRVSYSPAALTIEAVKRKINASAKCVAIPLEMIL